MIREDINCEVCSSQPAKVIWLRRRRGGLDRTFVCPSCARERSRLHNGAGLDLERLIEGARSVGDAGGASRYSCKYCGTTLADIIIDGKPGCCGCFERFAVEIAEAIESSQGRGQHVGKAPVR